MRVAIDIIRTPVIVKPRDASEATALRRYTNLIIIIIIITSAFHAKMCSHAWQHLSAQLNYVNDLVMSVHNAQN